LKREVVSGDYDYINSFMEGEEHLKLVSKEAISAQKMVVQLRSLISQPKSVRMYK
jgi:hypothetical protein